jgi:hypothetical protein
MGKVLFSGERPASQVLGVTDSILVLIANNDRSIAKLFCSKLKKLASYFNRIECWKSQNCIVLLIMK